MKAAKADIENLYMAILNLESLDEATHFFRDLLTPNEINEFTNRWKAARMLAEKISYTKIAKETGLSSTTIARISKWLKGREHGYQKAIAKMSHHGLSPLEKG